jgi:hypothetical protein
MDSNRKPRAREKRITENGKGVEKYGQGLGTGPVNNAGNYASRTEQYQKQNQAQRTNPLQRPEQRSYQSARRMNTPRPGSGAGQNHSARGTGSGPARASGGSGKLLGIIIVLVMLLGGGKLTGLFDGGNSGNSLPVTSVSGSTNTGGSQSSGSAGSGPASASSSSASGVSSGSGGINDRLSMLMGSGTGSV